MKELNIREITLNINKTSCAYRERSITTYCFQSRNVERMKGNVVSSEGRTEKLMYGCMDGWMDGWMEK